MSSENILRVTQALEVQPYFKYVLTDNEVKELQALGYKTRIINKLTSWLFDVEVSNNPITKRIILRIEGNDYVIAVNTKEGTIPETIERVQSMLTAVMIVRGYLNTWKGEIEVHPNNSKYIYESMVQILDEWKGRY